MVANNLFSVDSSTTAATTCSSLREVSSQYRESWQEEQQQVLAQTKIPTKIPTKKVGLTAAKEWVTPQKPVLNNLLAVECTLDEIIEEARRQDEGSGNQTTANRQEFQPNIADYARRRTHRIRQYGDPEMGCCAHSRGAHPYANPHRVMLGRNSTLGTGGFNGVGRYAPPAMAEPPPPRRHCHQVERNAGGCCSCQGEGRGDAPSSPQPQPQPPVIIQFQGFPGGYPTFTAPNFATPPPSNYYYSPGYNTGLDYGVMGQTDGWSSRPAFATPPSQVLNPVAQMRGSSSCGGGTTASTRRLRSVESQEISSDVEVVRMRKEQKNRSAKKSSKQAFFPMELIALDD